MPIPFNQKALPEHLGYFTVTGSFLNILSQVPSLGSFQASGTRKNWASNPAPSTINGWAGLSVMSTIVAGWFGGRLNTGTSATPYIFTDTSERSYATGDKVTMSVEYRVVDGGSASYVTVFPHLRIGNVYYRTGEQVTRPIIPGQIEKVVIQFTLPVDVPLNSLDLAIVPTDAATAFIPQETGFEFYGRRALIEDQFTAGGYFDGSSPTTDFVKYVWDGQENNSSSTATSLEFIPSPGRIQMLPIAGKVIFKPTITSPISDVTTGLTLVPTTITAYIDPDGRVIGPGDGKSSVPEVYDPDIRLLAPNQDVLSNTDWGWDIEVIPADGAYWQGFRMNIGSEARPGDMITLNESLVVDRDAALRPERVFLVQNTNPPLPFGFDPERDSLLVLPALTYWRVTA